MSPLVGRGLAGYSPGAGGAGGGLRGGLGVVDVSRRGAVPALGGIHPDTAERESATGQDEAGRHARGPRGDRVHHDPGGEQREAGKEI